MRPRTLLLAALLSHASMAPAQVPVPPDPEMITLPDMTPVRDRSVIANGWKYFYFHNAQVSYAEAYADFAECYRFLAGGTGYAANLPAFVPWGEPVRPETLVPAGNAYGLVGLAIGAMVAGPLERRHLQSRLRMCLEPRGYVRFPLRKEAWEQLVDNYSERSIAMQALAATGPTPDLPRVTR